MLKIDFIVTQIFTKKNQSYGNNMNLKSSLAYLSEVTIGYNSVGTYLVNRVDECYDQTLALNSNRNIVHVKISIS